MDEVYLSFLQLLDDSQLIDHINSLSQDAKSPTKVASKSASLIYTSTPAKRVDLAILVRSFESDPFDDSLDSQLLKIAVKQTSTTSLDTIPGNQLAIAQSGQDTSDDEEPPLRFPEENWQAEPISSTALPTHMVESLTSENIPRNEALIASGHDGHSEVANEENAQPPGEEGEADDAAADTSYGKVGKQHKFGDYGTYFQNKFLKQQLADQAYVEWDRERRRVLGETEEPSKIFEGCMIFVNGNTVPTLAVIHKLVILHGGKFLNYLHNKGAATHIICDRLTPRKKLEFRNYKVVKAMWIADCVEQNRLLDWKEYRLIDDVEYDQQRLGFERLANVDASSSEGFEDIEEEAMDDDEIDVDLVDMNPDQSTEFPVKQQLANATAAGERDSVDNEGGDEELPADNTSKLPIILQFKGARSNVRKHNAMDAKHPDFLKHFFANSRLHHLSTWKADLRSKFLRLVAGRAKPNETKAEIEETERIVLHVDFDCFFATASALSHPSLDINKDPIAVSHGGKSSDVASCNYVARRQGVLNGMWLGRAMKLCPNLQVIDYDFNTYEKCSSAFYNYLVSKDVFDSIFPVLIDEVLIDATSAFQGDGANKSVREFCEEIRADIFRLTRCSISIGVSSNVLLAKLAIKKAKPDGFFHLHENIESFLNGTKVRDIPGIGRSLSIRLAEELGLPANKDILIADVKGLSQSRLCNIFGEKTGLKLYENCRGIDHTKIALDLALSESLLGRKSVSVDINFGIRFDTHAQAEDFLMRLAKELHSRLIDLGLCGTGLTLKLARRSPGAPVNPPKFLGMGLVDFFSKSSRLGVPTNDWGVIGSEMKSVFRILNIPVEELRGIAVSMTKLEDVETVKKQRQRTLNFNQSKQVKVVPKIDSQSIPYAESVQNSESIDWEVYNQLPEEIRRELKQELLRRGIPVTGRERTPTNLSPTKANQQGRKVYIQQMFPTQANGPFKHTRVVESPKKKRKLQASPTKSPLPVKRQESPTPYDKTVSYDEDVLNEIPSSIRNEFFQDLEWHKRNRRLVFVSTKDKLKLRQQERQQIAENEITPEWLANRPSLSTIEEFSGARSLNELEEQVTEWIRESVQDHGPHHDDVQMFSTYIETLARQRNISRCVTLLRLMEREIECQKSIALITGVSSQEKSDLLAGVDEWLQHLKKMKNLVISICKGFRITVEF